MLRLLRKFLDPLRATGVFEKPAYTYKAGSAYVARAKATREQEAHALRVAAQTLAPSRFVSIGDCPFEPSYVSPTMNPLVEEVWEKVYAPVDGDSPAAVMAALGGGGQVLLGYRVSQRVVRAARHIEDFAEHVQSLQMQTKSEETYNGLYPTLGGHDANDRRSWITGGRTEYKRRTKGMIEWGTTPLEMRNTERALAKVADEKKAKKAADLKLTVERISKKMPRKLGEV